MQHRSCPQAGSLDGEPGPPHIRHLQTSTLHPRFYPRPRFPRLIILTTSKFSLPSVVFTNCCHEPDPLLTENTVMTEAGGQDAVLGFSLYAGDRGADLQYTVSEDKGDPGPAGRLWGWVNNKIKNSTATPRLGGRAHMGATTWRRGRWGGRPAELSPAHGSLVVQGDIHVDVAGRHLNGMHRAESRKAGRAHQGPGSWQHLQFLGRT